MQREINKVSTSGLGWQWIVLALVIAGAIVLGPVQAATLTVINTDDSGAGSLRQAIADASDGDAITFDSTLAGSAITLTSGELVVDKDLSIEGDLNSDGVPDVTVSGNDNSRVFSVSSAVVGLEGLVITAGAADVDGGGIDNNDGTITLTNSTVSGNITNNGGGGISNRDGTVTINSSTVSDNSSRTSGSDGGAGGISNLVGTVTINSSTISDNSPGGIYSLRGTVTINSSTVSDNSNNGVYSILGTVTINSSTVSDNNGGIYSENGTMTLTNSTVSGNNVGIGGGGISNRFGSTGMVINSTISRNSTAIGRGGGIYNEGILTLTNSTVSENSAGSVGGGIHNEPDGLLRIVNTIIANNEARGGEEGDCENRGTLDTANSANNLIETGCDAIATLTDDSQLGPLQDNGGPTETHALLPGSPAIDFITVADCEVTEDQRGVSRPQGFGCDIGAFEREVIPLPPPAPVPAAGKWALGVLAMLLLSAMVWLGRRQQRHLKG